MGPKACIFLDLRPGARDSDGFRQCVLTFKTTPSTSIPHEVLLEEGLMPGGVALDGQRRPFGFVIRGRKWLAATWACTNPSNRPGNASTRSRLLKLSDGPGR